MTLDALRTHGPATARETLRRLQPDSHEIRLERVVHDPAELDRLHVPEAIGVVRSLQQPCVLGRLLNRRQSRRGVLDALAQHPRFSQGVDAALEQHHPWACFDTAMLIERYPTAVPSVLPCGIAVAPTVLLSTWLRNRSPRCRATDYRSVLQHLPGPPPVALLLDAVLGRVPGLDPSELPWLPHDAAVPAASALGGFGEHSELQRETTRYPHVDAQLAQVIVVNGLSCQPFLHDFTDDALAVLVDSPLQALELFTSRRLPAVAHQEAVAALTLSDQARVLAAQPHPELLERFLPDFAGRLRGMNPLSGLVATEELPRAECLDAALRLSSPSALVVHLVGHGPNAVEPHDIDTVLQDMYCQPSIWLSTPTSLIRMLRPEHRTACGRHLVQRLLQWHPEVAELLGYDGLVGREAVGLVTEVLGDDPSAWDTLVALVPEWRGRLDELADTARCLAADR